MKTLRQFFGGVRGYSDTSGKSQTLRECFCLPAAFGQTFFSPVSLVKSVVCLFSHLKKKRFAPIGKITVFLKQRGERANATRKTPGNDTESAFDFDVRKIIIHRIFQNKETEGKRNAEHSGK